jgi:hypothetical protein
MTALLRSLLLGAVAWFGLMAVTPAPQAQADEYWDGYWGWYDNTYRPYTYRQFSPPNYGYYSGPAYGTFGSYNSPGFGYYGNPSGYGRGYSYYGGPGVGVAVGPRGGGAVVGPLQFGWR